MIPDQLLLRRVAIVSIIFGIFILVLHQISLYILLAEIAGSVVPMSTLGIAGPALTIGTARLVLDKRPKIILTKIIGGLAILFGLIAVGFFSWAISGSLESCQDSGLCGGWIGVFFIIGGILTIILNGILLVKAELIPAVPAISNWRSLIARRRSGTSEAPPTTSNAGATADLLRDGTNL